MDKWYIIISGLLLLLAAVLFIRLIQYKRQMRIFAAKLQKRLHGGVDQEIHVEYFDRDIVALAKALNDYFFKNEEFLEKFGAVLNNG